MARKPPPTRYWDSSNFISLVANLPEERDRVTAMRAILEDAQKQECRIATSTWTLVEAHRKKKEPRPTSHQSRRLFTEFFEHDFILLIDLDRVVAEEARRLCQDLPIKPHDAVHVASAIVAGAEVLETWDEKLVITLGKHRRKLPFKIQPPTPEAPFLFDPGKKKQD